MWMWPSVSVARAQLAPLVTVTGELISPLAETWRSFTQPSATE